MASVLQTVKATGDRRFLLQGIGWQTYEMLLADLADRSVRCTYDRGDLELMSPSRTHEYYSWNLGRLIAALTFELNIPICGGGSTTFRREDLEKGLEPDECFWIQHEAAVRAKGEIDLTCDPPPDLAVEIDITRSSLDRQEIYAALGVPEIWRFDGRSLFIYILQTDGSYDRESNSAAFRFLPVQELVPFLQPDENTDETSRLRSFVDWVRGQSFSV